MADEKSVLGFDLPNRDLAPDTPVQPQVGLQSALKAAKDLSFIDSPTNSLYRMYELNKVRRDTENLPKLTPEQLNEKYPDLPRKFEDPMNEKVAELIVGRQRERQNLQKIIDSGPQGKISTALKFGAMLVPQAVDPIGAVAGMGVSKLFGMALTGSRFAGSAIGKAVLAESPTASQILIRGATEGVAGNALAEAIPYMAAQDDMTDYTFEQAAVNVIGGTLGFTAGVAALKKGFDVAGNFVNRGGPKARAQALDIETAQVHAGNKVDAEALVARELVRETNVPNPDYKFVDAFDKLPEEIHIPKKVSGGDLKSENGFFSDGIYHNPERPMIEATDDPLIANNAAARKIEEGAGDVITAKLSPDTKIAFLDRPLEGETKAIFEDFLSSIGTKVDVEGLTGNQVIGVIEGRVREGALDDNILDGLHDRMRAGGYDFYHKVVDQVGGEPHRPHNAFYALNEDKLKESSRTQANSDLVPKMTQEEKQKLFESEQAQSSKRTFDESAQADWDRVLADPVKDVEIKELESELGNRQAELEASGTPEAKSELESYKKAEAKRKLDDVAFKAASLCVGKF